MQSTSVPGNDRLVRNHRRWTWGWILLFLGIALSGNFIPVYHGSYSSICTVCGKERTESTRSILGITVRHAVVETPDSSIAYDDLINEKHEHVWRRAGGSDSSGSLYSLWGTGDAEGDDKVQAVREAIVILDQRLRYLPIEQRKVIYHRIILTATNRFEGQAVFEAELARLGNEGEFGPQRTQAP